jgi:hypothetical protein
MRIVRTAPAVKPPAAGLPRERGGRFRLLEFLQTP